MKTCFCNSSCAVARGCSGPPNLSVQRHDHEFLIQWPLFYPSTGNSQGLVFGGHDGHQTTAAADSSSQGLAGRRFHLDARDHRDRKHLPIVVLRRAA